MVVQSVLIPKIFPMEDAVKWLKSHNYKLLKVDITDKFYRFRQKQPNKSAKYITKVLPNGIELVIEV